MFWHYIPHLKAVKYVLFLLGTITCTVDLFSSDSSDSSDTESNSDNENAEKTLNTNLEDEPVLERVLDEKTLTELAIKGRNKAVINITKNDINKANEALDRQIREDGKITAAAISKSNSCFIISPQESASLKFLAA